MLIAGLTGSVTTLGGVGKRIAEALSTLDVVSHADLLRHVPRAYLDRTRQRPLSRHEEGEVNTTATIAAHDWLGYGKRRTLKVLVRDETAVGTLLCFGRNFLAERLKVGVTIRLAGKFQLRYNEVQASAFEFSEHLDSTLFDCILPLYPLTQSLNQQLLRRIIRQALSLHAGQVSDEAPPGLLELFDLPPMREALETIHFPATMEAAERARRSLACQELFLLQLALVCRIYRRKRRERPVANPTRILFRRFLETLPFDLTSDQRRSLSEIQSDLSGTVPSSRLLQGDVGCGKTLVGLGAALLCIEYGRQVAFMAPTELLARQHAATAHRLLDGLGVQVGELYGGQGGAERAQVLQRLADGDIDLAIGTHALFSSSVRFHILGLVIVDEQQRFGVLQRSALIEKGRDPDLLLTTATPIPRSLALTVFGDLQTSHIRTMPPGRIPIETHLTRYGNEEQVYRRVAQEIAAGRQAYFIYPLIEQSDNLDLRDAETMFEHLRTKIFPELRLTLIHSRIGDEEKNERMSRFVAGEIDIIVATSVVEVGVDVANATCMVVEHAERFGLASLHQLRGRIGRGEHQSYAFFIYEPRLSDIAKRRLRAILKERDGFAIAEIDLELRGPGDLAGTRQAGLIDFRFARLPQDMDLLREARRCAFAIAKEDPRLEAPEYRLFRGALEAMMQEP